MGGKRPKEREKYVIRLEDGRLIDVTREVYLAWYQSQRKERYQKERDQKHNLCSIDLVQPYSGDSENCAKGLDEQMLKRFCVNKLYESMKYLSSQDFLLIRMLYFDDLTVKEIAKFCGCTPRTIYNRKKIILKQLRVKLLSEGINQEDLRFFCG